jgi:hypothetical protein
LASVASGKHRHGTRKENSLASDDADESYAFMVTSEASSKTVSVRIKATQVSRLREIVDQFPGGSINGVVQRAVDLWLEKEGTVYLAALREARGKVAQSKEAVQGRRAVKQEKAKR